jgi:hypothetical protein
MQRLFAFFVLGLLARPALAQDAPPTFYDDVDLGFYVSPDVRFTSINSEMAMFAGGRAGIVLDLGEIPALLVGVGGYALLSDIAADDEFEDGERLLQMGYAGLDVQYLMHTRSPVDVSLQFFMGAGSVNYKDKGNALNFSREDSEDFLVFEPGAGVQWRVRSFLRLVGHLNYRIVDDIQRFRGVTNASLGGFSGMIGITVGSF